MLCVSKVLTAALEEVWEAQESFSQHSINLCVCCDVCVLYKLTDLCKVPSCTLFLNPLHFPFLVFAVLTISPICVGWMQHRGVLNVGSKDVTRDEGGVVLSLGKLGSCTRIQHHHCLIQECRDEIVGQSFW